MANESRVFRLPAGMSTQVVANAVEAFLSSTKGMEVQSAETTEGYVVQGRQEKDGWKTIAGMRMATEHWQECSCGERLNVAKHIYGDWRETKPATETEAGSRERGCAVCEYVQTEAIPAAGTGSPQTGDSSDMALWISLMLASCGGVLGMLFYRRKKAVAGK